MNFNVSNIGGEMAGLFAILALVGLLVGAIVHIVFALGVYHSATNRTGMSGPQLVPSGIWALATLLGGVFVATAFWAIHHSSLAVIPHDVGESAA